MATADKIKELREKTGLSVMICKKALEESKGNEAKAMEWLRKNGVEVAEKKASRGTKAGIVEAYIHGNGQVGVLIEMKSETDFVAKNPEFKALAHDIAMHIAALGPTDIKSLLDQEFIKDPGLKISDFITKHIQKFGENIEITRFERFAL